MHYRILSLLDLYNRIWRECPETLPQTGRTFTPAEQVVNLRNLDTTLADLDTTQQISNRFIARDRFTHTIQNLLAGLMGFEQPQLDVLFSKDSIKAAVDFVNMAKKYDPNLPIADIYQAARNVWAMTGMQYMFGLPVELTPSMFAYSLLYPYTDNYLDDPTIPAKTKLSFNDRFGKRINGEKAKPKNDYEKRVFELIGMIEKQWDRKHYPLVYESLIAIHIAQIKSMRLLDQNANLDTEQVLSISLEKGGASVLADGYLVSGELTPEQEKFLFGYGAFLQLLDDLQDVNVDKANGQQSVYTECLGKTKLDKLTNKTFHFSTGVMQTIEEMGLNGKTEIMKTMMGNSAHNMLIDAAGRSNTYYTDSYIRKLEQQSPLSFERVAEKRKTIAQNTDKFNSWFELFSERKPKQQQTIPIKESVISA